MLVGRDKERSRKVLEGYVERFGLLANATVDLPAAQAHHRSFRTAYERTTFKFGSYTTSTKALAAADLVVNATPLGMNEGDGSPFDVELLSAGQTVFDAVYGHGETALVRARARSGMYGARRRRDAGSAGGGYRARRVRPRRGRRRPV